MTDNWARSWKLVPREAAKRLAEHHKAFGHPIENDLCPECMGRELHRYKTEQQLIAIMAPLHKMLEERP